MDPKTRNIAEYAILYNAWRLGQEKTRVSPNGPSPVTVYGSIKTAIQEGLARAKPTTINDQPGLELDLSTPEHTVKLLVAENPDGSHSLVSRQEGETVTTGTTLVDPETHQVAVVNGTATRTYADGSKVTAELDTEGKPIRVFIDSLQGNIVLTPNELGHLRLNPDGTPKDGIARDFETGVRVYYQGGKVRQTIIPMDIMQVRKTEDGDLEFTRVPSSDGSPQSLKIKYDTDGHAVDAQYSMPTSPPQSLPDGGPVAFRDEELKRALENAMRDGNLPNPWDLGGPPGPVAVPSAMFIDTMVGPGGLSVPFVLQGPSMAIPGPVLGPVTASLAQPAATSAPKGVEYEFKGDEDPDFTPQPSWWQKVKDWFRKGYRYVGEEELKQIRETGKLQPKIDPTTGKRQMFITLDKYKSAQIAKDRLQLPKGEKLYRVEFDMKNVKGRSAFTEVGKHGNAARNNPQFGKGGGSESITPDAIDVDITKVVPIAD